jgi:hypothetical protein
MIRPARYDAADLVALADAWWPAFFSAMHAPRPMATLSFTLQIYVDPASLDPEVPLFHRSSSPGGLDGYLSDQRELFAADGRIVASNPQTFVVIK